MAELADAYGSVYAPSVYLQLEYTILHKLMWIKQNAPPRTLRPCKIYGVKI